MTSLSYTDSDGVDLTITPVDATTYYGTAPAVSLAVVHPDGDADPVVYVDVADIEVLIERLRAVAVYARALHTCPDSEPCPAHDIPATTAVTR